MAIRTKQLAVLNDDRSGLNAVAEIDYDDARLRLTAFRIINPTSRAIIGEVIRSLDGQRVTQTFFFQAGATASFPIPVDDANRIPVTLDARGRVNGADYAFRWVV